MAVELVRVCPACGAHHSPDRLRCSCGAWLFGVDLTRPVMVLAEDAERAEPVEVSEPMEAARLAAHAPPMLDTPGSSNTSGASAADEQTAGPARCPYEDCAQDNPAGSLRCLYCNRPMQAAASGPGAAEEPVAALLQLPSALRSRYRVLRMFEAQGAEADILLVEASAGTPLVAKIYRQGILPSAEVQARIAQVDARHRVSMLETGRSDGRAYEVMEYCAHGSLRQYMQAQSHPAAFIADVIRELAAALSAVHSAALVHRDLKPENVLLRAKSPLDLVLTDFSTASVMDATQRFTGMARTLLYAPPEALSGVLDAKADYWALGMMLLEMALGAHPFEGLSEAVILHHLTTRAVDVSGVSDVRLGQLIRGLLLRDPKRRWGASEVKRWLAGDRSLPQVVEQGVEAGFIRPYAVLHERCSTPEQLAVAFARHWQAGVSDLVNGQLLRWFTDVQKDQNAVRLLLDLRYDRQLSPDEQLLRFILHFAPGIPPMWKGRGIELGALLTQASQALQGDAAAAQWLWEVRQHKVLDVYASAGNAKAAELAERWSAMADDFEAAWAERMALMKNHATSVRGPASVVLYDDVVYGQRAAGRSARPSPAALQPRLLAAAYDTAWIERLRSRMQPELAVLTLSCPWLAELGELQSMTAAQLLACEALLPELRQSAEQQARRDAEQKKHQAAISTELQAALQLNLTLISAQARKLSFMLPESMRLRDLLDDHLSLMERIRAHPATDDKWLAVRRQALRTEPLVSRLRSTCERLSERRAANAGWWSEESLRFFVIGVVVAVFFWGGSGALIGLAIAAAILAWRYLPIWHKIQDIHRLAKRAGRLQGGSGR